jgi:queuine/archaeosine tRNA-ribosyltransferase
VADICLIYARDDEKMVGVLADVLATKYSVWWDRQIHSGDYRAEIERQLKTARCVISVWSRSSRTNRNVLDEANFATTNHVPLLPVRMELVDPPLGFGGLHTVDLIGWNGDIDDHRIRLLLRNIENTILIRPHALNIDGKRILLPAFFRSVSSYETALRPDAAIHALNLVPPDSVLVSAYDILNEPEEQRKQIIADLNSLADSTDTLVLLDSGNYEASRKQDKSWTADRFHEALQIAPHDLSLCFDELSPPNEVDAIVRGVIESVERNSHYAKKPVLPIVHAPRTDGGEINFDVIPEALKRVSKAIRPTAVAIPERELGSGILARARMVHSIRSALNELGFYQPLHLLGTGNPLSIAIFCAVGADWFDGLEWCRTVADAETGRLYHLQQYDLFAWQSEHAASQVVREAVASEKIAYAGKVIFHNLEFLSEWMKDLRDHLHSGKIERFLTSKLPGGTESMQLLEKAVPEVFG